MNRRCVYELHKVINEILQCKITFCLNILHLPEMNIDTFDVLNEEHSYPENPDNLRLHSSNSVRNSILNAFLAIVVDPVMKMQSYPAAHPH